MSDECCFVTSGSQFPKSYMEHIHGTMQEQKLLWAMAKELKKRREHAVICARGWRPPHVSLMAMSHVLEDVEALIKTIDNKEVRNG